MARLTKKYDDGSYGIEKCTCEHEDKLGQLEDIEERMGCPLEIMLQVFRKGIYVKNGYATHGMEYWHPQKIKVIDAGSQWDICKIGRQNKYVASFNYKKSWALTKEELE